MKKKERLEFYDIKLKEAYEDFNKIQKKSNDKLDDLKKLVDKCNILEEFNVEYLKELKKIEKKEIFQKSLELYEESLSKEAMMLK